VTLRPEAELLLACARVTPDPGARGPIARLAGLADWDAFMALAARHGLQQLAYEHLATAGDVVPKPVMVRLWSWRERLVRQNRLMAAELAGLLTVLAREGIDAIPYKGPALAEELYGDVGLRQFGDLDILLAPADVLRAKALLEARGYASDFPLTPATEQAFLHAAAQYHLAMTREDRSVVVELHWRIDPDIAIEPGDRSARAFSPDELLLVLLIHGSKHRWSSLGWVVDVAEALRRGNLDWASIAARARSLRCERRVALGLLLANRLLQAPVPADVLARYAALPGIEALCGELGGSLLEIDPGERGAFDMLRDNLGLYDTPGQRMKHLLDTLWSPSLVEWTRWPLPRALHILYPALRIARLAAKHLTFRSRPQIPAGATPRTPAPPPHWKD
jgi:hypothetical protein